jgi:seryl-tRNA(Sec) selenium transferase
VTTLSPAEPERKATGLLRGQAAKIARIHRVSITYVLRCAKEGKGRPALLATIEEYRQRNIAAAAADSAAA